MTPTPRPTLQARGLIAYTPGGFCHIDLSRPVSTAPLHGSRKKRSKAKPSDKVQLPPGCNCRIFHLDHPCLFMGFTAADAAVLVEKPWEDVLNKLPPPLYKHRYGT